jgi:hypothetical protein
MYFVLIFGYNIFVHVIKFCIHVQLLNFLCILEHLHIEYYLNLYVAMENISVHECGHEKFSL